MRKLDLAKMILEKGERKGLLSWVIEQTKEGKEPTKFIVLASFLPDEIVITANVPETGEWDGFTYPVWEEPTNGKR